MEAGLQEHIAFYLTGSRPGTGLEAIDALDLRPALFAHYRDLTHAAIRLSARAGRQRFTDRASVRSLSAVIDDVVRDAAQGDDRDRLPQHALRLEQRIRAAVASGAYGPCRICGTMRSVRSRRQTATTRLVESLQRLSAARTIDGRT